MPHELGGAVLMPQALVSTEIRERGGTVPDSSCRDLRRTEEQRHQQRLQGARRPLSPELFRVRRLWLICLLQEWERTGTVWEQYGSSTGKGQRR